MTDRIMLPPLGDDPATYPIGTVVVHPDDDRMSPTARRRVAVDASDFCGPYEGCRWQRLTGAGTGDGGSDPLHSRDVACWPVQPLAELAVVLGHPMATAPVDGDLRARCISALAEKPLEFISPDEFGGYDIHNAELVDIVLGEVQPELEQLKTAAIRAETADAMRGTEVWQLEAQVMHDGDTVDELADEVVRLAAVLASERAVYADSPGDRLWHDSDKTWWRRAKDGRLVRADAPPEVGQLARDRDDARAALDDLARQRDTWWNVQAAKRHRLADLLRGMARRATVLRRQRDTAQTEVESFYSATRRLAGMFWLDPEDHQALDVLGRIGYQLAAWRADAAQVPEGWQSLVRKGWSVGASRPAIAADAEGSFGQRCEEQGRIPAGRYYLTHGIEVDENGRVVSRFDVPGGVNIRGFWQSSKTRIEPAPVSGSDTTAPALKRQWTDSTGIVWQETQPGLVHVVSPMTGQPHMFGEPVELEKVEAKFGPLTAAAVPTPDTDTTEVPGER